MRSFTILREPLCVLTVPDDSVLANRTLPRANEVLLVVIPALREIARGRCPTDQRFWRLMRECGIEATPEAVQLYRQQQEMRRHLQ